ncbi:beta-class carbonic anhydrase [Modestobacter sp. SYSU DS0875]
MTEIDRMLAANAEWLDEFPGPMPVAPARKVAVVACMDSRMPLFGLLGLAVGDAHVLRNAGGLVTEDTLRSLAISQHLLGTRSVVLVHHTDCGLNKATEEQFRAAVEEATGVRPPWPAGAFTDLDADVRESIRRVREAPYLVTEEIRGTVYDVATGRLREVS